jgi:hypothetical protein
MNAAKKPIDPKTKILEGLTEASKLLDEAYNAAHRAAEWAEIAATELPQKDVQTHMRILHTSADMLGLRIKLDKIGQEIWVSQ